MGVLTKNTIFEYHKDNHLMDNFFSEFDAQSKADWIEAITQKLKGKDFETLQTQSYEGIELFPFYTKEDKPKILLSREDFGEDAWQNIVEISTEKSLERSIDTASDSGVDALFFDIKANKFPLEAIFRIIDNQELRLIFKIDSKHIEDIIQKDFKGIVIYDFTDKIEDKYLESLSQLLAWAKVKPYVKTLSISTLDFVNSGANAVQELAFGLAILVEYFDKLTDKGLAIEDLAKQVSFSLGIGENYFIELAKFRALRVLWKTVTKHFQVEASPLYIQASNTTRNKAEADAYNNILRTSTEAMSAIIGGANAVKILPYNATFEAKNEFSERIARNISLILKHESHLAKVKDAGAGSYYIEFLTEELAKQAWALFQKIEERGGFSRALGFIQSEITQTQKLRQANFESQKDILVGVNKYTS